MSTKIYVGNLPWRATDEQLAEMFGAHGEVIEARIINDRETGRSRGFGFVTMTASDAAQNAIRALNGYSMQGRPLVVNQVEISLMQLGAFENGTLDQCLKLRIRPMAWSPLGAGLLGEGGVDLLPGQRGYRPAAVVEVLDRVARKVGKTRTAVAIAWLLKHPAGIIPIIGSTKPARIADAVSGADLKLEREDWYELLSAARAEALP